MLFKVNANLALLRESESVDFSAAVTEDYYAEAWVLV